MAPYELGVLTDQQRNIPGHFRQAYSLEFAGALKKRASEHVTQLKTLHVIEGAQIIGFSKKHLAGHKVELLEADEDELLRRLKQRGL